MEAQGPSVKDLLQRFRVDVSTLLQQVLPLLHTLQALSESKAEDKIYELYSGPSTSNRYDPASHRDLLQLFLRGINGIRQECGKRVSIQGYGDTLAVEDLVQFMVQGIGTGDNFLLPCTILCKEWRMQVPQTVHGMVDLLETDLWTNFYHFLSSRFGTLRITKRIYIHGSSLANSMRILRACCGLLDHPSCQGLMELKIAGPGCGARLDTIVVYLTDDQAVKSFLFLMKHLNLNPGWFAHGVPKGVEEVLPGVGLADEPPDIGLIQVIDFEDVSEEDRLQNQEGQSFGSFLAKLMVIAMKDCHSEVAFLTNLLNLFRLCNIDPANPHIHGGRQMLEMLHVQGQSAQWQRRGNKK